MRVATYRRPATLADALYLLSRPDAVAVGGGTTVRTQPGPQRAQAVDLQALPLHELRQEAPERVVIEAMVTLQQLADADWLPVELRTAARRERPSALRTLATVGGAVSRREPDSELLATLLAHDAAVELAVPLAASTVPLAQLLGRADPAPRPELVTAVRLDPRGRTAVARVGRTPADRPIVVAVARAAPDGSTRLAVAGVAAVPVLTDDPATLRPPADFRGSSEYRRSLAVTLAARALAQLEASRP